MNVNTPGAAGRKKIKVKMVLAIVFALVLLYFSLMYGQKQNIVSLFPTENQILIFSNRAISKEKGNESSEFNVYLLKNLNTDKPEKSFVSKFTMPFRKEIDFIAHIPETDLFWYNLIETGDNQWSFVNMTSAGTKLFDVSYSPLLKKLNVSELKGTYPIYIYGFINGYNKQDGVFYTQQFGYYDRNGKEIRDNSKYSGYNEVSGKLIKFNDFSPVVTIHLDDNSIVYNFYHNYDGKSFDLLNIKLNQKKSEKNTEKLYEKLIQKNNTIIPDNKVITANTGQRMQSIAGIMLDYSPMAASPDKKKVAIVRDYRDFSTFPPQCTPSYIKDYQNWSEVLWLVIWDTEKNEIEKVVPLPCSSIIAMPFSLLWAPEPNSQYISYCGYDGLYVIDISKKTVKQISKDYPFVNVIRWSPDGSMLGFLDYKGVLYVYNVAKDITTNISYDRDYFNFVWVK